MKLGPVPAWAALTILLSLPAPRRPPPAPRLRPTALVTADFRCPGAVDPGDPLAVAGAAARWLYCGSGPPGILSAHAAGVVAHRAKPPYRGAAVTDLVLPDPRSRPVVVLVSVTGAGEPVTLHILMTLFRRPAGHWIVDDVAIIG